MLHRPTDMVNDYLITDMSLEIVKNLDRSEKQKEHDKKNKQRRQSERRR
jgi:hypothetical protein